MYDSHGQFHQTEKRARFQQGFVRRADFLAGGIDVDLLGASPEESDEQSNSQGGSDLRLGPAGRSKRVVGFVEGRVAAASPGARLAHLCSD